MAKVPFAEWRPVSLRSSQYRINPAGLVYHTAVSNATVLIPTGTVRWHFYNNKHGKLYQFFDTTVSAACQLDGNYWTENGKPFGFLSMETWDGAGTSVWPDYRTNHNGGPRWTDDQMETNAKLAHWIHEEYGITLQLATGARGRGFGYHRQFTNTYPYEWNSSHACPGNRRADQVPVAITNAKKYDDPPVPVEPEDWWETVTPEEAQKVMEKAIDAKMERIVGRVLNETIPTGIPELDTGDNPGRSIGWHLRTIRKRIDAIATLEERTAAIEANRHAEGSVERREITQVVSNIKSTLADIDKSE